MEFELESVEAGDFVRDAAWCTPLSGALCAVTQKGKREIRGVFKKFAART